MTVSEWITTFGEATAAVMAGVAALYGGAKYIYKTAKRVDHMISKLDRIDAALGPNGGSSIRDAVDRIESNQHQHMARLRAIADRDEDGTFECDATGHKLWVNRAYCRITGLTQEQSLDYGWMTAVHPADRQRVQDEWARCVKEKRDFFLPCICLIDGKHVCKRATVITDKYGNVTGFLGFLREIKGEADCQLHCTQTTSS